MRFLVFSTLSNRTNRTVVFRATRFDFLLYMHLKLISQQCVTIFGWSQFLKSGFWWCCHLRLLDFICLIIFRLLWTIVEFPVKKTTIKQSSISAHKWLQCSLRTCEVCHCADRQRISSNCHQQICLCNF